MGDEAGICRFESLPAGCYDVRIVYFSDAVPAGTLQLTASCRDTLYVQIAPMNLEEAVVVARESRGKATASVIGRDAMEHLQPSSIADLFELLPGGRAKDPDFSSAQIVRIREAGISGSDYATTSLGTQFTVDGVPVSTNANLQQTPAYSRYGSSFVNQGVDMRMIATDDIERVEIVRGIASAEYGDLTSGLVNIVRKKGGRDFEARFKSDMKSRLLYLGKGMELASAAAPLRLNAGFGYLDSRADPRNLRQNYKRLNASLRLNQSFAGDRLVTEWGMSADYAGSFDNVKSDRDIDYGTYGPIERYRSQYNRFSAQADFSLRPAAVSGLFRSLSLKASLAVENDVIDRWRYVAMSTEVPVSTVVEEGVYNVEALPVQYEAAMRVEGIPLNAFVKAVADFGYRRRSLENRVKTGWEWSADKNYGAGVIFDRNRPFSPDMNVRPRVFRDIPAMHRVSVFAEDVFRTGIGAGRLEIMAGIRASSLLGLDARYRIGHTVFPDPRVNATFSFPEARLAGYPLSVSVSAGAGWHTKFPTMAHLYPDPLYYDVVQMNYWPADKSKRLINLRVFRIDPVNYGLDAARNFKQEIRTDFEWRQNRLSVTCFREDLRSGFRTAGELASLVYRDYDEQSVDGSALTGPPDLSSVPFSVDTLLLTYGVASNGSRTLKEGVEFTFSSERIRVLRTRVIVNGAWFRTVYRNSLPGYYQPSVTVGGAEYPYVGYYAETDGYLREVFNTNFTFDTQVPELGLIFTTSLQCQWFTGARTLPRNPYPDYYIDKDLRWHEFTPASAEDGVLALLIRNGDPSLFRYSRIPFSMNVNLKITKKFLRDSAMLAVFVNKLLDCSPPYLTNGGLLVRRSVLPYFGMELNFRL